MKPRQPAQATPVPNEKIPQRRHMRLQPFKDVAFDFAIGSLILVVCIPIMLIVAAAVRLSGPGPVLFRQPRRGLNGRVIMVLKFRTLRADCEDPLCRRQVEDNDPRVTAIGAVLRHTSLDELPQLINVLKGDMSLVGPRPHAVGMTVEGRLNAETVANYTQRYAVKPGITGLAQVRGSRGRVDTAEQLHQRVCYDLEYINRRSVLLDLKILARTTLQIVTGFRLGSPKPKTQPPQPCPDATFISAKYDQL